MKLLNICMTYIAVYLLLILAITKADKLEDIQRTHNVTTLYPVSSKPDLSRRINYTNESESQTVKEKSKTDVTTWKLEAAFAETNLDKDKDGNITGVEEKAMENNGSEVFKPSQPLGSFFDEEELPATSSYKAFTEVRRPPATGHISSPKEQYYNTQKEKPKEVYEEIPGYTKFPYTFEKASKTKVKDLNSEILESKPTAEIPVRVPGVYGISEGNEFPGSSEVYKSPVFYGSSESHRYPGLNGNSEVYKIPEGHGSSEIHGYPALNGNSGYKFPEFHRTPETHSFTPYGNPEDQRLGGFHKHPIPYGYNQVHGKPGSHGVPSVSVMPAGGLYELTDPFKEGPGLLNSGEYNWKVNGDVVESHTKRTNPLKNLLHFITAFLPVGLIISALTPSVITIQNTDNQQTPNPYRRSDPAPDVTPISERCRRRLLCELQSDANYTPTQKGKRKHCYKIYCEDTQALWSLLHWLLRRHKNGDDHRDRSIT